MKENMKSTKGITLIALVITIIVLLILAIVTIRIITTGGIIEHARNGAEAYNDAQTNELALLKDAENKMAELKAGGGSSSNWYILSQEEQAEADSLQEGLIAFNSAETKGILYINAFDKYDSDGEGFKAVIILSNNTYLVAYTEMTNAMKQEFISYASYYGISNIEIGKWYVTPGGSDIYPTSAYTGSCPISLSDFEGGTIHMTNFVNRIIGSF